MRLKTFLLFVKWKIQEEKDTLHLQAYRDIRRWYWEVNSNKGDLLVVLNQGITTGRTLSEDVKEIATLQGCYYYMKDVLEGVEKVTIPNVKGDEPTQPSLWDTTERDET